MRPQERRPYARIESPLSAGAEDHPMSEKNPTKPAGGAAKAVEILAYSATGPRSGLGPATIRRRAPLPRDVQIEILFCGVCHSDLHQVRNEWAKSMPTTYPCVPGHEIVGRVAQVGSAVRKLRE